MYVQIHGKYVCLFKSDYAFISVDEYFKLTPVMKQSYIDFLRKHSCAHPDTHLFTHTHIHTYAVI